MNIKKIGLLTVLVFTVFIGLILGLTKIKAQVGNENTGNNPPFSYAGMSRVIDVSTDNKTATISYAAPLSMCSINFCPTGRKPDVVKQGEILILNALDQAENDITKIKVNDLVTVYLKLQDSAYIPYALKDTNIASKGCDLNTKICVGEAVVGSSTSSLSKPLMFMKNLNAGVKSDDVRILQEKLKNIGYLPESVFISGYFGQMTKQAVSELQRAFNLPHTGFFGSLTREKLNNLLKSNLVKICPEKWIDNEMPRVIDDLNGVKTPEFPRQYFILDGKRRELVEFDMDFVKKNCSVKPEVVY